MAKKERVAIKFVKKTNGDILFAVTGMPERTVGPKETAHYILFSGNKNMRYKMKINKVEFAVDENGIIDRTKVIKAIPNFTEVKGQELAAMYSKCCPSFKKAFPLE